MQRHKQHRLIRALQSPWGLGLLFSALLFTLLYCLYTPQYVTNDDAVILRAFMGYEGGEPAIFHLYTHTALAWLLYGLAKLFPGIAWFSILQIMFLYLSFAVIIKSFAQLSARNLQIRHGALPGACFGMLFTAAFALFYVVRITYSFTAVLLGTAALAHLFSIDFEQERGVILRLLGGAALLLCNYCIRQITVVPVLFFYALAAGIKLLAGSRSRKAVRPVLIGLLCTALLFGLFAGIREADIYLSGEQDYIDWQNARISVMDYTNFFHQVSPETLERIGWSENLKVLVDTWFFLDDRISVDALRTIHAQITQDTQLPLVLHMADAWKRSANLFAVNRRITLAVFGALLAALSGLLAARRRDRLWAALGSACALLGGAILLLYFAWLGRLYDRIAFMALLPMSLYLAISAFAFARPLSSLRTRKLLTGITVLILLSAAAANGLAVTAALHDAEQKDHKYWGESIPENDINEYALRNPHSLFIHDYTMSSNETVFPDTRFGIPHNVISWGGWAIHSPSWRHTLQNFGVHALNASIFLRDNVIFASRYDHPPQALLAYLQENTEDTVNWEFYDTYGAIYFFIFNAD